MMKECIGIVCNRCGVSATTQHDDVLINRGEGARGSPLSLTWDQS